MQPFAVIGNPAIGNGQLFSVFTFQTFSGTLTLKAWFYKSFLYLSQPLQIERTE